MKFVICLTELAGFTSYTGGVGRRYAATIPELARQGHDVTVVLVADSAIVSAPAEIDGVTVVVNTDLVRLPWRLRSLPRVLLFRRILSRIEAENVYVPEWLGSCSFAPRNVNLVTNLVASLGLITEIAGPDAVARRSALKSWLDRFQIWCEDRQIRRSMAVIACSSAILDWNSKRFAGKLPDGRVVANCINVERASGIARTAQVPHLWPTGPGPVVVFAGRVQLIKGIDVAMSAFRDVAAQFEDARFVIAGGEGDTTIDPSLEQLQSELDPSLRDRTVFLGQIDEESLYACMREATVVVCPSRWEAFGNIALEVRASGGVLIATTGSGFSESCDDMVDSLLVEPGNPEALAAAIIRVVSDATLRARLLEDGRRRVDDFTASTTAARLSLQLESIWN
ncbi:glycosyltransferase family 4 protein [Pseudarthrobacter sp. MDT3-26]|uniref:glycosyltransferase family 4 protein n=1 Tax=Pseudarthrobacter raffinosi TaxID=2953651 RepID=UPI00208FC09F|nr:glycosyltransferase family 4 protein [Pseudarthrobacter sp. MDT3-26]MCO4264406.1 glycosyltransferase family 4 protein [Pseudarthrobacter sp. MDT3-26]